MPEAALVDVVERHELEPDLGGDPILRSVPEPWPFPRPARVMPDVVAAVDLAEKASAELAKLGRARLGRACTFPRASPPHGLNLLEHADRLQLVTAPDCGQLVEGFPNVAPPEPLSQAALEALAIVAFEQPVSRAGISHIGVPTARA